MLVSNIKCGMIFHQPHKRVQIPQLSIENEEMECVDTFNLLGITLDKHLNWKAHINYISSKISRTIGILNRLKHFLPLNIKVTIYNSLIASHINYGILAWGNRFNRILKLQKKAVRIIGVSKYNAHTEPLFKKFRLLRVHDTFNLFQLKFYYRYLRDQLPFYFQQMPFASNVDLTHHSYFTRQHNYLSTPMVKHEFAKNCIRYGIPKLINNTALNIKEKLYTHSFKGFTNYVKKCILITTKRLVM